MDQSQKTTQPSGEELSRRELLKVLAASGSGLLAAAFLPGKWLKPVIEAGVLPAHAQATYTVHIAMVELACSPPPEPDPHPDLQYYQGIGTYVDDLCGVGENVVPHFSVESGPVFPAYWDVHGEPCTGNFYFGFWCDPPTRGCLYAEVGTRVTNTICSNIEGCG